MMGSCIGKKKVAYVPNEHNVDLSHFEILDQVGKGGFAEVHAARHLLTGATVALKVIPKRRVLIPRKAKSTSSGDEGEGDTQSVKAARSRSNSTEFRISTSVFVERRVLECLDGTSAFLPRLLYAFQNADSLFMVLPFFAGGDLQHHINQVGPLPEAAIRFYAAEISLALEALHTRLIVYRDLKPRNVLLTSEGHVVLTDFGLCRLLADEADMLITGRAGTKGYLAPEALKGEKYRFSVDFFSLGATLYKLATKKLPFGKTEDFSSRSVKWGNIPPGLKEFLQGLMELDSKHRLGCGPDGWLEVKRHQFFEGMDWDRLARKAITPPYIPETDTITSNCPDTFKPSRYDKMVARAGDANQLSEQQQQLFAGFEYNCYEKEAAAKR